MDLSALGIETNFSTLDWCIVIGYLLVIVAVVGTVVTRQSLKAFRELNEQSVIVGGAVVSLYVDDPAA